MCEGETLHHQCGNIVVEHRSPRDKGFIIGGKEEEIESPRGERQGGDEERERVKLTALVPVPI